MSTVINIELLNRVEEILDLQPSRFDYTSYIREANECGTVGCIAGHICMICEPDRAYFSYHNQAMANLGIRHSAVNSYVLSMLFDGGCLFPLHGCSTWTDYPIAEAKLRIAVLKLIPPHWFDDSTWFIHLFRLGVSSDFKSDWSNAHEDIRKFCIAVQKLQQQFIEDNDIDVGEHCDFDFCEPAYRFIPDIRDYNSVTNIPDLSTL